MTTIDSPVDGTTVQLVCCIQASSFESHGDTDQAHHDQDQASSAKIYSENFIVGDYKWRLLIFPAGNKAMNSEEGKLSIYLQCRGPAYVQTGDARMHDAPHTTTRSSCAADVSLAPVSKKALEFCRAHRTARLLTKRIVAAAHESDVASIKDPDECQSDSDGMEQQRHTVRCSTTDTLHLPGRQGHVDSQASNVVETEHEQCNLNVTTDMADSDDVSVEIPLYSESEPNHNEISPECPVEQMHIEPIVHAQPVDDASMPDSRSEPILDYESEGTEEELQPTVTTLAEIITPSHEAISSEYDVDTRVTISLLPAKENFAPIERSFRHRYQKQSDDWGFIDVTENGRYDDPENGLVDDDGVVTVVVDLTVYTFEYTVLLDRMRAACTYGQGINWISVVSVINQNSTIVNDEILEDTYSRTPLHLAVENQKYDYTRFMLSRGACVDMRDRRSRTPLHLAVENGDTAMIEMLVCQFRANINDADDDNETPIFKCMRLVPNEESRVHEMLRCMICRLGANIHVQNKQGRTILFSAARRGFMGIVFWLVLDLHIDVRVVDNHGDSAASRAERHGMNEIANYLFQLMTS